MHQTRIHCLPLWLIAILCFFGVGPLRVSAQTATPTVEPTTTPTPCPDCSRLGYLSVGGQRSTFRCRR